MTKHKQIFLPVCMWDVVPTAIRDSLCEKPRIFGWQDLPKGQHMPYIKIKVIFYIKYSLFSAREALMPRSGLRKCLHQPRRWKSCSRLDALVLVWAAVPCGWPLGPSVCMLAPTRSISDERHEEASSTEELRRFPPSSVRRQTQLRSISAD